MQRLALIILLHFGGSAFGQSISGVIKDAVTNKPIAFANFKIPNSRKGTSTDIDGKFILRTPENYTGNILISHVSYENMTITLNTLSENNGEILLSAKTTNLHELLFVAGENPAHAIIRQAVSNRKKNDPNRLTSYQYKSYSKQLVKLDGDSQSADSILYALNQTDTLQLTREDSTILEVDSLVKRQHFFLSESVTEKKYLSPGLVNERLLAINTSGFKSPLFATTGTDYQPLGFYDEVITLLGKPHTNPIAEGTLRRYEFYIEDTTYYQQDTVFVLSFSPKKNKKFESLSGQISISKNGYAIKNVIAHTADSLAKTDIKIQQYYECFDDIWFPSQLHTDIVFKEYDVYGRRLLIEVKSYFSEIKLNQPLSKKEFRDVALELLDIKDDINKQTLSTYRKHQLDSLELKTYIVWDTLSNKLNKVSDVMEYALTASIPIRKVDLKLNKFLQFNQYEKVRVGVGGFTNQKFSKLIKLGAYTGYGFNDKAWKYGGSLQFNLSRRTSTYFKLSYAKDLIELGRLNHFDNAKVLNKQLLRSIEGSNYNLYEAYTISLHRRIAPFTYSQLSLEKIRSTPSYSYSYAGDTGVSHTSFDFTEFSAVMRYVKKEKYLNLRGRKILFGHDYPIITLSYRQGISDLFVGDFNYNRIDLSVDFEKQSRFGATKIYLKGGLIDGDVPLNKLITGQGNNSSFFVVPHYFQTMGQYEFVSDMEASIFINHNFGNILLNTKLMKPELILYQNTSFGQLSNKQRHQNFEFSTLEQGYFESGIGLSNLLRVNYIDMAYLGIGTDVFYRSGAYAFTKTSDNFAVRFNFDFSF